jgi:uncharacterized damage-inducible protein DinB
MANSNDPLRAHLVSALDWEEAHVGFDKAIAGIPVEQRGARAAGFEHSLWQLVEHIRLAQKDILDFCVNPQYEHTMKWPDDYWPRDPAPSDAAAWDQSIAAFKSDREKMKKLAASADLDILATVPTGKEKHTYLRAFLLVIDHNAHHLGQIVAVRKALGIWK